VTTAVHPVAGPPPTPPSAGVVPHRNRFNWSRMWVIARTDLRSLLLQRDFWLPMALLGSFFFVIVPVFLLGVIGMIGTNDAVQGVAQAVQALPQAAQQSIPEISPIGKVQYMIAVFGLAPIAVVVPLTISSAIGASTIVGERERGTGEFLAHSPADTREIYIGKLLASIIPGYITTVVGFGVYALLVNLIVAPKVGYWFFPTTSWWLLIVWVLPPFLAITLSLVLRLSSRVKSTAAAQQATGLVTLPLILIAYGQSTGALASGGLMVSFIIGLIAWVIAALSLLTGVRSIKRGQLLGVADGT
jgi:ABC-2 type transport system permease protein